jgi:glycerol-3-phosphate O-acyltransferase
MSLGLQRLSLLQYFRLKWYLALRAVLHIWVRSKLFPGPLGKSGINPDIPACYIMDTYALSSVLILDRACELNGLKRPLYPIEDGPVAQSRAWAALRRLKGIVIRRHSSRRSPEMLTQLANTR